MKNRIWRFFVTGENNAFFNMALDEALLILCLKKKLPATLRLYQWKSPSVSLGYSQKTKEAVDLAFCRNKKIDVVRRITGGRAVLHGGDLTYSLCAAKDNFGSLGEKVNDTYAKISRSFLLALKHFDIKGNWIKGSRKKRSDERDFNLRAPCFLSSSKYEIDVNGKKLIGSAQRRFKDGFIQQGSILLRRGQFDLADLLVAHGGKQKIKDSLRESSAAFEELTGGDVSLDRLICAIKDGFEKFFSVKLEQRGLTEDELCLAEKLLKEKYLSLDWNLKG